MLPTSLPCTPAELQLAVESARSAERAKAGVEALLGTPPEAERVAWLHRVQADAARRIALPGSLLSRRHEHERRLCGLLKLLSRLCRQRIAWLQSVLTSEISMLAGATKLAPTKV